MSAGRLTAWVAHIDRLLAAYADAGDVPTRLRRKLESLRHKRDTAVTKQAALAHHALLGRDRARAELELATRELGEAWRAVVADLARSSAELQPQEQDS